MLCRRYETVPTPLTNLTKPRAKDGDLVSLSYVVTYLSCFSDSVRGADKTRAMAMVMMG